VPALFADHVCGQANRLARPAAPAAIENVGKFQKANYDGKF
jgi:hypothetical protein